MRTNEHPLAAGLALVLATALAAAPGCGGTPPDPASPAPDPGGKADNPTGTALVTFPVANGAGYPFAPECYTIRLWDVPDAAQYPGKLKEIVYGFTSKSKAAYLEDNDVPWENAAGEQKHEGVIALSHQHDGGYKGSMQLVPPAPVAVPSGRNLVFKLRLDKYAGSCVNDGDTQWLGDTLTKTYFVEVPEPRRVLWAGGLGSYRPTSGDYLEGALFNADLSTASGCWNHGSSMSSYVERAIRVYVPAITDVPYAGDAERSAAAALITAEVFSDIGGTWSVRPAKFVRQIGNDFLYTFFPFTEFCAGGGPNLGALIPDGTYAYKLRFSTDGGSTWFWRGTADGPSGGGDLALDFAAHCSYFNQPGSCVP